MSLMPSKVKIGWKYYSIDFDWSSPKELFGQCDHVASTIKIDRDLRGAARIETFLHEVLHATWDIWGLTTAVHTGNDTEEKVVTGLGHGLTTVFLDNPDLLPYIYAEIVKPTDVKGEC